MLYEVVDPELRRERGPMFDTLSRATENAGSDCEVWQLADDDIQTRMCRVYPEPDTPRFDELAEARAERATAIYLGRAEREATEILDSASTGTYEGLHNAFTLAWLKGFMCGFGQVVGRMDEVLARYEAKR